MMKSNEFGIEWNCSLSLRSKFQQQFKSLPNQCNDCNEFYSISNCNFRLLQAILVFQNESIYSKNLIEKKIHSQSSIRIETCVCVCLCVSLCASIHSTMILMNLFVLIQLISRRKNKNEANWLCESSFSMWKVLKFFSHQGSTRFDSSKKSSNQLDWFNDSSHRCKQSSNKDCCRRSNILDRLECRNHSIICIGYKSEDDKCIECFIIDQIAQST